MRPGTPAFLKVYFREHLNFPLATAEMMKAGSPVLRMPLGDKKLEGIAAVADQWNAH
jgi:hypothetical protein